MIATGSTTQVWAYAHPCDLRKGYNGLYGLATQAMGRDPMEGDLFLFVSRRRTSCKILHHDGTGLAIYMKRLDSNRFAQLWLRNTEGNVELSPSELALFLEGNIEVGYRRLSPARKT